MNKKEQRNIQLNKDIWIKYTKEVAGYNINDEAFTKQLFNEKNITHYDQARPDFIIENKQLNIVFGVEHFEFNNSTQNNNGGSIYSQKSSETRKLHRSQEELKLKDLQKDEIIQTNESYKIHSSASNIYDNFKKSFSNHYKRIPDYIDLLKEYDNGETKFKIGFLVEDNSPLGSIDLEDMKTISAFEIFEIMNLVVKADSIDFIIFAHPLSEKSIIFLRDNIQETVASMKLKSVKDLKIADIEIIDLQSTTKI